MKRYRSGLLLAVIFCFLLFVTNALPTTALAYSLKDDSSGGDCTLIGTWDSVTKTCTLTSNIDTTSTAVSQCSVREFFYTYMYDCLISIDNDYITLDGNGFALDGSAGWNSIGIYLSERTGVTIKNFQVKNFGWGIYSQFSSANTISNNIIIGGGEEGIYLNRNGSATLAGNTLNGYRIGIDLWWPTGNITVNNNCIKSNSYAGSYITSYTNATFTGNTFLNNRYGLLLYHSNEYVVYHNNFIENSTQIFNQSGSILNQESPIGGNYWSDFDTPEEGCYDTNNDGFCDAPYYLGDYLPWVKYSGWKAPEDIVLPTTTATITGTLGNNNYYISAVKVT